MNIRYRVTLSQTEREQLTARLSGGKHPSRQLKRAQILLAADADITDDAIAATLSVSGSTVDRTKRRFVEGNLELALAEEARPGTARLSYDFPPEFGDYGSPTVGGRPPLVKGDGS